MAVEEARLESVAAGEMMNRSGLVSSNLGYTRKMQDDKLAGQAQLGVEVAASDGDNTVSGSILQQHLDEITFFLGSPEQEVRFASLNLIGMMCCNISLCC